MVDGVADEVAQRIAHRLDDVAIQLDVGALHVEVDLLPQPVGQVADRAREPLGEGGERRQARIHHAAVEVARGASQAVDFRLEGPADVLGKPLGGFAKPGNALQHLGGLIEQLIERERADADGGLGPQLFRFGHRRRLHDGRQLLRRRGRGRRERGGASRSGGAYIGRLDLGQPQERLAHFVERLVAGEGGGDGRPSPLRHELGGKRIHLDQHPEGLELALDDERARAGSGARLHEHDGDLEPGKRRVDGRRGRRDRLVRRRRRRRRIGQRLRRMQEPRDQRR